MKKKYKKIITAAVSAAFIGSMSVMSVMATNWTAYYNWLVLDFSTGNPYAYTEAERKDNDSSAYVYSGEESEGSCTVSVYGSNGSSIDTSVSSQHKSISPGEGTYLWNYVNESGYDYAGICAESEYDYPYSVLFGWQTDTRD